VTCAGFAREYEHLSGRCKPAPRQSGRGMTVACADPNCTQEHLQAARQLLGSTGSARVVERRALIDAATGVSGSGPAYLFYIADCLLRPAWRRVFPGMWRKDLLGPTVSGAGELPTCKLQVSRRASEMTSLSPAGTTRSRV